MAKTRRSSADPGPYPEAGTFGQLLDWHLKWGTRPGCDTQDCVNIPWTKSEFAQFVHGNNSPILLKSAVANVNNWIGGGLPQEIRDADRIDAIFRELFHDDTKLAQWSNDLARALARDREDQLARIARRNVSSLRSVTVANDVAAGSHLTLAVREDYLSLLKNIGRDLGKRAGIGAVGRIGREYQHLRAEVERAVVSKDFAGVLPATDALIRYTLLASAPIDLVESLASAYLDHGYDRERARCLWGIGHFLLARGEHERAEKAFTPALSLFRRVSEPSGFADCKNGLGEIHLRNGYLGSARPDFSHAIELSREAGYLGGEIDGLLGLGDAERRCGNYDGALSYYDNAVDLCHRDENVLGEARCGTRYARCCLAQGKADVAERFYQEALKAYRELEDPLSTASSLLDLAHFYEFSSEIPRTKYGEVLSYISTARELYEAAQSPLGIRRCSDFEKRYAKE